MKPQLYASHNIKRMMSSIILKLIASVKWLPHCKFTDTSSLEK